MQDGQHGLGLGHKLDAVNNRMCIVVLVVSSVGLLKWLSLLSGAGVTKHMSTNSILHCSGQGFSE